MMSSWRFSLIIPLCIISDCAFGTTRKKLLCAYLWFLGIPSRTTVLREFDCYVAWLVTVVWVVSVSEYDFFDFSNAVVEETPLWFEIFFSFILRKWYAGDPWDGYRCCVWMTPPWDTLAAWYSTMIRVIIAWSCRHKKWRKVLPAWVSCDPTSSPS